MHEYHVKGKTHGDAAGGIPAVASLLFVFILVLPVFTPVAATQPEDELLYFRRNTTIDKVQTTYAGSTIRGVAVRSPGIAYLAGVGLDSDGHMALVQHSSQAIGFVDSDGDGRVDNRVIQRRVCAVRFERIVEFLDDGVDGLDGSAGNGAFDYSPGSPLGERDHETLVHAPELRNWSFVSYSENIKYDEAYVNISMVNRGGYDPVEKMDMDFTLYINVTVHLYIRRGIGNVTVFSVSDGTVVKGIKRVEGYSVGMSVKYDIDLRGWESGGGLLLFMNKVFAGIGYTGTYEGSEIIGGEENITVEADDGREMIKASTSGTRAGGGGTLVDAGSRPRAEKQRLLKERIRLNFGWSPSDSTDIGWARNGTVDGSDEGVNFQTSRFMYTSQSIGKMTFRGALFYAGEVIKSGGTVVIDPTISSTAFGALKESGENIIRFLTESNRYLMLEVLVLTVIASGYVAVKVEASKRKKN